MTKLKKYLALLLVKLCTKLGHSVTIKLETESTLEIYSNGNVGL